MTPQNENGETGIIMESAAARVKRMQALSVVARSQAIRQRVPELPPYLVLSHTVNRMAARAEITPDEYMRWTAGMLSAVRQPLFTKN
ncbi:MAG: hypothetical protein GYB64_03750 [Chloroflexi bacterium]|nr:hypothetical protein [Chloroflexota bacterium]